MEMLTKPIADLKPAPYNPRQISDDAIKGLTSSIDEFGYVEPIIWNKKTGFVIGGHQRLKVLKEKGLTEIQVVAVEFDEAKEKALNVSLNNRHIMGDWSEEIRVLLEEIENDNEELFASLGMDTLQLDINKMFPEPPADGETEADEVPDPQAEAQTSKGELWLLGNHRLLCGDATKLEDISKLMGSIQADLVFTDPPYNVDYEGYTKERLKIKNDKVGIEEFKQFLKDVFVGYSTACKEGASFYVCHPSSYQREFQNAIETAGYQVRCQIIWAKNTFAWGMGRYKFQHEPIMYCHKKGCSDPWYGDKSQSTLWQVDKPAANKVHPTMKPTALIDHALANSSKKGDVVLDLFGGSGSTMIACQQRHRNCYMMELDPIYVDVIIKRWQDFTGEKAKRDDGMLFDDLKN